MFRSAFLAALVVSAAALAQPAMSSKSMPAPLSTAQKATRSDAVVVGKVTEIEKDEVEATPVVGASEKVKMRVAVVKIADGLIGATNVTHVKVLIPGAAAERPAQPAQPLPGAPIVIRTGGGFPPVILKEGDEGVYFLLKHRTETNYYLIQPHIPPVQVTADTYKDDLAKVKAVVATLADPLKALKAEKIEDRLAAASALLHKYNHGPGGPATKQVAIPAEETKAILKALHDADWTAADTPQPGQVIDYSVQPTAIVHLLGWLPGRPNGLTPLNLKPGESRSAKHHEAYKVWYAEYGDKFEIKKFVPKD